MFNRPSHIECPTSVSLLLAITLSLCVLHTQCGSGVLNNFPIKFEMLGTTTYIPDSGGVSRNGYKLRIGFQNYQWLAVEIITNTDKNDVLVMQINQFYTEGSSPLRTGHEVSVTDYYRSGDFLTDDQNNQYDISSFNYVKNK